MRIFYACIKNLVIVAFPLLIAINCFYFLLFLNPELDFLGVNTFHYETLQTLADRCPNGGTVYFGFTSLKSLISMLPTDNTVNVIKGLGYSFYVANFAIPYSIPTMNSIDNESIINFLQVFYVVLGYLFQPLMALAWFGYAVYELLIEIWGFLEVIFNAFGGMFATYRCSYYPQELFVIPQVLLAFK